MNTIELQGILGGALQEKFNLTSLLDYIKGNIDTMS